MGRRVSRRELLALMGGAAATLAGSAWVFSTRSQQPSPMPAAGTAATQLTPGCVVRPQQTEGPYFVDERLNRSDIRSDPATGVVKAGVPLHLTFRVSRIDGTACSPLAGALVDVWHCDALGAYSDARDQGGGFDTRGMKFLRGYQITDTRGVAQFDTIYPGWYRGRTVHIHFKIRTSPQAAQGQEFTSQLYFDEAITDQVHAQSPYNSKGRRDTMNAADGIFRNGGAQLLVPLTRQGQGYAGVFDIGLRLT